MTIDTTADGTAAGAQGSTSEAAIGSTGQTKTNGTLAATAAGAKGKRGKPQHAKRLLEALGAIDVYRDKTSDHLFCDIIENDVRRTYPLESDDFKATLFRLSTGLNRGIAMPPRAIQSVIDTCIGRGTNAQAYDVFLRFGRQDNEVWIDLGNDKWEFIHITPKTWEIVSYAHVPLHFWRPSGLLPLPYPERVPANKAPHFIEIIMTELFHLDSKQILLLTTALTATMCCKSPYCILNFFGGPGRAKTTTMRTARQAIDPVRTPHINIPNSIEDIMIYARSHAIPCIDNASSLSNEMLDAVCGIATGQGHADRSHYTRDEATDFMVTRPLWFTSIGPVTMRGDTSSRAIDLLASRITSNERKLAQEIERFFNDLHPKLLGSLLEVASAGLNGTPRPAELPRTADFYYWGLATAEILKPLGDFATVFGEHKDTQAKQAVENNPVSLAIDALFMLNDPSYGSTPPMTGVTNVVIVHNSATATLRPNPNAAQPSQSASGTQTSVPSGSWQTPRFFILRGTFDFDTNGNVIKWAGRMSDLHHDLAVVKYGQTTAKEPGFPMTPQYLSTALDNATEHLETALGLRIEKPTGALGKQRQHRPKVEIHRVP